MTAVEWLVQEANLLENNGWIISLIEQANELFEQQIINAWEDVGTDGVTTAEEYYNETFKNTEE